GHPREVEIELRFGDGIDKGLAQQLPLQVVLKDRVALAQALQRVGCVEMRSRQAVSIVGRQGLFAAEGLQEIDDCLERIKGLLHPAVPWASAVELLIHPAEAQVGGGEARI